jgi:uncharacterized delta-60 repeat protein
MRIRVLAVAALAFCAPVALEASNRSAGELDPSFGDQGRVFVRAGGSSAAADIVVQPDRKLVLAGIAGDGNPPSNFDFLAVRLNRNGSRDGSFGNGGIMRTSVELGGPRGAELAAVAVAPQGAIVLAGRAYKSQGGLTDLAVVRLTPSGALDTSFSDDGVQTIDVGPNDTLSGVAVQPDGKLVLVGSWYGTWPASSGFIVIRLLPNGALDDSFGSGGIVNTNLGGSLPDAANAVAILADGKIVVTGSADFYFDGYAMRQDVGVARYLTNGLLDPTFGAGGVVVTPGPRVEAGCGVAATSGGKILIAGTDTTHGYRGYGETSQFHLVRYLPSGALDPGFGAGGVVTTTFAGMYAWACSVAVQRDGRILAGGSAFVPVTEGSTKIALARYTSGGRLDETFSGDGKRIYDLRTGDDFANALALQRHAARSGADRLVLAGSSQRQSDGFEDVAAIGIDLGAQPVRCRVPNVVGWTLARAKARIRSAQCRIGRVRHARSSRPRGRIVSQRPRAGRILPLRSRVALVVSRGR